MNKLLDRFLYYVSFDTQSKSGVKHVPSTDGQWKLVHALKNELVELELADITLNDYGCLMATLPSNVSWPVPIIGFIAHIDTAPDFTGKNVNPQIVEQYRGGDIALGNSDEVLSPSMFPVLHKLIGHTLITTDGRTLLGADDKAGLAEIITAIARIKEQNIPHGTIRIAFTPDEEVGKGTQFFDIERFGAEWAYTLDGSDVGELEYENFNAASVTVKIVGNNVHPGIAKGVMINALSLAARYHQMMPAAESPEATAGYEGFYHLNTMKGSVDKVEMHYIVRDFNRQQFELRKQFMITSAETLGKGLHPDCCIKLSIEDSYYNMHEHVANRPHIIELARQAIVDCGVIPVIKPIRGGTDGAQLSWHGLPCPNLFTGGYNCHGKHEVASQDVMEKAVQVITRLASLTAFRAKGVHAKSEPAAE